MSPVFSRDLDKEIYGPLASLDLWPLGFGAICFFAIIASLWLHSVWLLWAGVCGEAIALPWLITARFWMEQHAAARWMDRMDSYTTQP